MRTSEHPDADNWLPDPDFGGRSVRVIEFNRPGRDDDAVTAQTIRLMHLLANRDAQSPIIKAAARAIADSIRIEHSAQSVADAVFCFAQKHVTYQREEFMRTPFSDLLRYVYDQTLIAPAALLAMPRPAGDCVDFSMLVAALLHCYGIPCAFKTIAADPVHPDLYSHVYVVCQLAPGQFYVLDASNGPAPGFEFDLPHGRKSRLWPNPADLNRRKPFMIHDAHRARRLGDVLSTDPGSGEAPEYNGGPPADPSAASSPSGWTTIATRVIDDASRIAAPLIRQSNVQAPYYITGANGAQILYDPSTGRTANAGAASERTPAVISQNLLIGGALFAAALVAISASRK